MTSLSESLSQALSVWFQTPAFWLVIAVLFLGLEMVNRRLVLFLPIAIASLVVGLLGLPLPANWPQFSLMPENWMGVLALWVLLSLFGSTICMMIRCRFSRHRSRRRRVTRTNTRT